MPRHVFYSFHYTADAWRASQVRNMGIVDGNTPAHDNDWETLKRGGDAAIERWIEGQLNGRSCTVVLVGAETANRPWVLYEIQRSWDLKKGVFGIHVHSLSDSRRGPSAKGANPFLKVWPQAGHVIDLHETPSDSKQAYAHIAANIAQWIDNAVQFRLSQK